MTNTATPKKSDLPARVASAVVMVLVAGTALWLGGWAWTGFVALVALGVLWEWAKLAFAIAAKGWARALWLVGGVVYIGVAAELLVSVRAYFINTTIFVVLTVVLVDIGAYFAGRLIGGPKIAPRISPSKTWAGLAGGALAAALAFGVWNYLERNSLACDTGAWHCVSMVGLAVESVLPGVIVAVIAQSGDFLESWMKRRAGVKDSGNLLPGHGGLFDRVDGLLAVCFVMQALAVMTTGHGAFDNVYEGHAVVAVKPNP